MAITPQRIVFAAERIASFGPGRHLDIGCGEGLLLRELDGVIDCVGLERSEQKAKLCDADMRIVIGDACHLPFMEHIFDSISALEVIEHVSAGELDGLIHNLHRCLKFRGIVTISTPFSDFRSIIFDPAWYLGHRHFSAADLVQLFNASKGWQCSYTEIKGGWWEILTMWNYYICKYILDIKMFKKKWFEGRRSYEYLQSSNSFATLHAQFIKYF